jgi:trehalose-phosphatase
MEIADGCSSKDLRNHWDYLQQRIAASARLCVLSDFDGTLVTLEAHPDLPRLKGEARRVLEDLHRGTRVVLGVVSGRSLLDLVPRVDIPGIWYVGNHGYEIRSPRGEERRFYEPEDVLFLAGVGSEMGRELREVPGVFLEHKGPVLAVHYRGVEESRVRDVEQGFLAVMDRHRTRLMISRGHAVFEARLRSGANKGRAVSHIRHDLPAGTLVLYFGDDLTDRDAFRELRGVGISVEIGGGESTIADFTLPDPGAVLETLRSIHSAVSAHRQTHPRSRRRFGRNAE